MKKSNKSKSAYAEFSCLRNNHITFNQLITNNNQLLNVTCERDLSKKFHSCITSTLVANQKSLKSEIFCETLFCTLIKYSQVNLL